MFDQSSGKMFPGLVVDLFLRQSALSLSRIVSHRSKVLKVTYRHPCSNNNQWSPLEAYQGLFLFSL